MTYSTTIACKDCGHPVQTTRSNTRYCSVHRLLRDLPYVAEGSNSIRKCELCEQPFKPLDPHGALCAKHVPRRQKLGEAVCYLCGKTDTRVRAEIDVCTTCALDPTKRSGLFDVLTQLERKRTGDTAPDLVGGPAPAEEPAAEDTGPKLARMQGDTAAQRTRVWLEPENEQVMSDWTRDDARGCWWKVIRIERVKVLRDRLTEAGYEIEELAEVAA